MLLITMRTTDDLGMNACPPQWSPVIFHGLCCEFGSDPPNSERQAIVHLVSVYIGAGTSRFAFFRCPDFLSNLLMLLFVHPLSGNSFLNCIALYPFNWYDFSLESYLRRWKSCLQTMQYGNIMTWQVIATLNIVRKKSRSCNCNNSVRKQSLFHALSNTRRILKIG